MKNYLMTIYKHPAVFFNYDHYDNYNDDYHSNTGSGSE